MAFFAFTDVSDEVFVFRLVDPALIAHARALEAGETEANARIGGTITKAPVNYNIGWSYHLDPARVFFFEMSTEVGDSTMRYIEGHLGKIGGVLLPGSVWTGWSSDLLGELAAQSGTTGEDVLAGTRGADLLRGFGGEDRLIGRAGDDHLVGGRGDDRLFGGAGDDKLAGGPGEDWLRGGAGDDVLVGGAGTDVFEFVASGRSGEDIVLDFEPGEDRLRFHASWAAAVGDLDGDGTIGAGALVAAFAARRGDLVLRLDGDTSLTLKGVAPEALGAEDLLIG
ncbi:hypothetical protein BH23PSE1_BH23PSE1_13220 [soil metagenome]